MPAMSESLRSTQRKLVPPEKKLTQVRPVLHPENQISAGEDPKQYGRKDRRDTCYSTIFVMVSCRLGKIKPRKISCCCCHFDVLLFLFVLCRHANCEVTRRIY